jgi:hypothetical protein
MKRPPFTLATIVSTGPAILAVSDGSTYTKATPCPKCGETFVSGDRIAKTHERWMHEACAKEYIADAAPSMAWLMLAKDAAHSPQRYKRTQLREILNAVVDVAFGAEIEEHTAHTEALVFAYERHVNAEHIGADAYGDPREFAARYAQGDWYTEWDDRLPVDEAWTRYATEWLDDHKENSVQIPWVGRDDPRYRAALDQFAHCFGVRVEDRFPTEWWGVSDVDGAASVSVSENLLWVLAGMSPNPDAAFVAERLITDEARPLTPVTHYRELWGGPRLVPDAS